VDFGARVVIEGDEGARVIWDNPEKARAFIRRQGHDTRLVVSIEREVPRRTAAQNRLIWRNYTVALRKAAGLSGHTTKELHEAMKQRFLEPTLIYAPDGSVIGETYTTRTLTTVQASEYIDRVLALFAGYGVELMA
jgi:hypothetical protein